MAATAPFAIVTASVGKTIAVTGSATSTLDSSVFYAPTILVTNPNTATVWIRLVSSTQTAVATAADVAVPPNTVLLFANPSPAGTTGIGVFATLTTAAGSVYFSPGHGGI